ncbi:MAG: cyclic nucleotide-binding domain-containing protein [Candidatus Nitrohelix vancouverensis]|uniref:Cyclic nucleotide-binding domain-containing protein n=1 Tax=Candidatus Nitrohelix vancouverensis TaxID=2705534 RepID=A0A7T0C0Q4_9BACT|nr:MAG: cyclic nucleotide-binding domain-containing protein [Candidatus Nitrohelix vancouverensis]
MESKEIIALMDNISFFDDFSEGEKETLSRIENHILSPDPGDLIIRQGDTDSTIFVLIKGQVAITRNEIPGEELNTLSAGAVFGEVPLITGSARSTNVMAKESVVLLKMDGYLFNNLDPAILNKFKDQLLKLLIKRMGEMNEAMAKLKQENLGTYVRKN